MDGRQRWFTIGKHGSPWTPELARKRALELLLLIGNGIDPQTEKKKRRQRCSFSEFATCYLNEYARVHKKPRSVRLDETNLRHHILPLVGSRLLDELRRADIVELQRDVAGGKTARMSAARLKNGMAVRGGQVAANRCLTLLSKMFNLAEEMGLRETHSNPVSGIRKFTESRRERYLSEQEFLALGKALDKACRSAVLNPFALNAIRLLILTGARLGEVLSLKWEYVDFARRLLLLPASKSGQKVIRLPQPAADLLAATPRIKNNPYVVAGTDGDHLKNIYPTWEWVRNEAGLSNVRVHDLRHSFASIAAYQGKSLQTIGALLGHARTETTERYAHLRPDHILLAAEDVAAHLDRLLSPPQGSVEPSDTR